MTAVGAAPAPARAAIATWFAALTPAPDHYTLEMMTPNAPGSDQVPAELLLDEWQKLTGRKGQLFCYQVGDNHVLGHYRILRARTKGIYTILDQSSSAVKAS